MAKVPYVDKDVCISCGVCTDNAPTVFRFDADMKAEVFDPDGDTEEAIQSVMDLCPVSCISWKDE